MTADRSAEEATEPTLVELVMSNPDSAELLYSARDVLAIVRSLPTEDLSLLLAGRPIEERAQAAGLERVVQFGDHFIYTDGRRAVSRIAPLYVEVPPWVAIPKGTP